MALNDSETLHLFQTIIDNLPSGVTLMDKDLRFVAWNSQIKRLLDFPDELFAPEPPDLTRLLRYNAQRGEYGPGDPEELVRAGLERARRMLPHVFERTRPDGTVLEIRGVPLPDGGFVSTYTDMTQRKHAEDELRRIASYFQAVLDNLPFGVVVMDKELRIVYWSGMSEKLFGLPAGFVEKQMPLDSVLRTFAERGDYGPGNVEEQVAKRMEIIGNFEAHALELPRVGGGVLLVRGVPVLVDAVPTGFVLLAEDISERKTYQEKLEQLATTDHLTGLLNRRAFLEAAEREIRRAHRFGQSISVLMIDVDLFKSINDRYGHAVGDEVLRRVGSELHHALRDEDIAGRIGGEEFAVILVQATLAVATRVAERVRLAFAGASVDAGTGSIGFTASLGIASFAEGVDNVHHLLSIADQGLYVAKNSGRNRVHCVQAGLEPAEVGTEANR
ncbi:MAG: PAS-domain containing protein [Sulfuritalea sp.]|nr:PAS-domain containing protein [Sulfuritalea sp.]